MSQTEQNGNNRSNVKTQKNMYLLPPDLQSVSQYYPPKQGQSLGLIYSYQLKHSNVKDSSLEHNRPSHMLSCIKEVPQSYLQASKKSKSQIGKKSSIQEYTNATQSAFWQIKLEKSKQTYRKRQEQKRQEPKQQRVEEMIDPIWNNERQMNPFEQIDFPIKAEKEDLFLNISDYNKEEGWFSLCTESRLI